MSFRMLSQKSKNEYQFDEVISSLQKSIRRGQEQQAMFWALEMADSGFGGWLWKRLVIIAFEDIGHSDPAVVSLVVSGFMATNGLAKTKKDIPYEMLGTVIISMCRAEKSREGDDLCWLMLEKRKKGFRMEISDEAKDMHTESGRALKRGYGHWFQEASTLRNQEVKGPFQYRHAVKELVGRNGGAEV